jgi:hypothetical protein
MRVGMREPGYPAARAIAGKLEEYFARHHREAEGSGHKLAPAPDATTIEAVIDAAFWASLRREEGYETRISLAYLTPEDAGYPMRFERGLRLEASVLTKVAPAVERAGVHLGVWCEDGEWRVWGTTRTLPSLCFVLEVTAPGLLVIKHHRGEELGKFLNVAVLEGDRIKIVDEKASSLPDCPELLNSLLGFDSAASWADSVNVLVQLAVSMRGHGRGGSLLMVPTGSERWRESVVQPVPYAVAPAFSKLGKLLQVEPDDQRLPRWQEALTKAVDWIAGLTAVDGAAVITRDHDVLGFGAKIARRNGWAQVEEVMVTEPVEGSSAARVRPEQLGGTRHLSAAQFVHDQRDSIALVASQDGRFTVFAWSPCEEMVHAHRVETLLL